jgi:hypothetical protein
MEDRSEHSTEEKRRHLEANRMGFLQLSCLHAACGHAGQIRRLQMKPGEPEKDSKSGVRKGQRRIKRQQFANTAADCPRIH